MKKTRKIQWTIGILVIAGTITSLSFMNLSEHLVYFFTPQEAVAKASTLTNQTIKVGGMVKSGSVQWKPEELSLTFVVTDYASEIKVSHKGTPPDMFKENQGVVVEGRLLSASEMTSRHLMVKHSEEYKKPDGHGSLDKELLEKSLFKNQ